MLFICKPPEQGWTLIMTQTPRTQFCSSLIQHTSVSKQLIIVCKLWYNVKYD